MRLEGKVAIITGAGAGIGRASARRFASEGATVIAADINDAGAAETAAQSDSIHAQTVDVSNGKSVAEMISSVVDRFGRLDVVFSNAGIMRDGNVIDLSEDDWDSVLAAQERSLRIDVEHGIPVVF